MLAENIKLRQDLLAKEHELEKAREYAAGLESYIDSLKHELMGAALDLTKYQQSYILSLEQQLQSSPETEE